MSKRIFMGSILVLFLLAVTTVSVSAESGTIVITGGTLSVTADDVTMSGITLNGSDQVSTSASGANEWSAQDSRGTGEGWHLTIQATDFTSGANTIAIDEVGSKFQIQLLDDNITLVSGNTKPTSNVTTLTDIPKSSALNFASAAIGTGMGVYDINPNFRLEVPASAAPGSYTSTITITAVSGP